MKLIASGGGTGGHVYPALTVLDVLLRREQPVEGLPSLAPGDLLWIGSRGGMEEELVRRAGIEFVGLPAGGLRGMGLQVKVRNSLLILRSIGRARKILAGFQPGVVFVTGGYACTAVTLAAWLDRIPVVIYLPDVVPGQAIRFLSRFATRILVTSEASSPYFRRDKMVITGYPVRPEIYALDKTQARQDLGLAAEDKTLLVFGGSRGARSINRALVAGLRELLPACQVVHVTGRLDADWVAGATRGLPGELLERYHTYSYLHDMPRAVVAADVAVARAGAATLGEFPAAGLPAILVPYPYSGQHQLPNAEYLANSGAARILADEALERELVPTVLRLIHNEQALNSMREAARAMARPDAAQAIARQLWLVAHQRSTKAKA
ncbi:MAG TPA: undecaprenyldiphospho-muramoylpentapeptide beta-N-acetylglucosaminyltransferase [Anaerolineae bacterium]|nr:undecaprenyldiphospho-muramoylpentapeptide beta-N-acetylglucosaminyltransferase [Anaerolineae bacterium]